MRNSRVVDGVERSAGIVLARACSTRVSCQILLEDVIYVEVLRINARLAAERFFGDNGDVHRFRERARAAARAGVRGAQKEETGLEQRRHRPRVQCVYTIKK